MNARPDFKQVASAKPVVLQQQQQQVMPRICAIKEQQQRHPHGGPL